MVERRRAHAFLERDGAACSVSTERGEFAWQFVDLLRWPSTNAPRPRSAAKPSAQQPFDLEKGPLCGQPGAPGRTGAPAWVTLHHIVADGWSLNLLLDEFSRLYAEACGGQPADLAPLELHYAEFAAWQRQWLDAGEGARQLAYWRGAWATRRRC
nr:condensation domain-containing protein [Pseudomonas aeruginosa]